MGPHRALQAGGPAGEPGVSGSSFFVGTTFWGWIKGKPKGRQLPPVAGVSFVVLGTKPDRLFLTAFSCLRENVSARISLQCVKSDAMGSDPNA